MFVLYGKAVADVHARDMRVNARLGSRHRKRVGPGALEDCCGKHVFRGGVGGTKPSGCELSSRADLFWKLPGLSVSVPAFNQRLYVIHMCCRHHIYIMELNARFLDCMSTADARPSSTGVLACVVLF